MAASLDTLLASLQNLVVAINGWTQATTNINGLANVNNIVGPTVVKSSPGRVCSVVVVAQGAGDGSIYDAASVALIGSSKIFPVPHGLAVGLYPVGINVSYGIVVIPGTGQTLTVSYS